MMRFGIALPNFRPFGTRDGLVEIAREAGGLGYHSIWSTDVVALGHGTDDERFSHCLEAVTVATYLAALTTSIELGISVLALPQRNPVLVAKELATLDCLSAGRVALGVGAGCHEMQFRWLGVDFRRRGERLDECTLPMRELWTAPVTRFQGRYVSFSDLVFPPRPVQPLGRPSSSGAAARARCDARRRWATGGIPSVSRRRSMQTA